MLPEPANLAVHAGVWRDMAPHTATLSRLAADATVIIEFGVRAGVSTWALLDGLPGQGRLWSVDIDPHSTRAIPRRVRNDPRWRLLIMDDRREDIQDWLPPRADLVLIDTTHEYHQTRHELDLAHVLEARVILCHDYALPDVEDAVMGFSRRRPYALEVEDSEWSLAILRRLT